MLRLDWRKNAREDVRRIFTYVASHNEAAANRLALRINACAERLIEYPYMYRSGRVPGTREALAHPNYIIIYRVRADSVEIVNVIHARQQYP